MDEKKKRPPQWTLSALITVVVVLAVIACISLPGIAASRRSHNEREASAMLKTIATAQADFRSNDLDNDRAQNFWVYDVAGLYALCPSTNGASVPAPDRSTMLRLIQPSLAAADATDVVEHAPGMMADAFGPWSPRHGYVFRAFRSYSTANGTTNYAMPGGIAAWGHVNNFGKFAFQALPLGVGEGRLLFMMDENITIFRGDPGSAYRGTYSVDGPRAHFRWSDAVINGAAITSDTPFPSSSYYSPRGGPD